MVLQQVCNGCLDLGRIHLIHQRLLLPCLPRCCNPFWRMEADVRQHPLQHCVQPPGTDVVQEAVGLLSHPRQGMHSSVCEAQLHPLRSQQQLQQPEQQQSIVFVG